MVDPIHAKFAVALGVDAIGVIFAPSARRVSLETARAIAMVVPPVVTLVAVMVDPSEEEIRVVRSVLPQAVFQFCGKESPALCRSAGGAYLKLFPVSSDDTMGAYDIASEWDEALPLFDTRSPLGGGSGQTFEWNRVATLASRRPIVVAGGLSAENVAECIHRIRPFAVDVRSGIETDERKDFRKMEAFVETVRKADATTHHAEE
ncbi:MAG TPA: phosphoribosylanthranilate isomerase [Candidatus Baltobacteraceae bacterium]|jgi:phosphoribosylanthranilate isomerase|nr:phosphoribosylanthranilate isomerase [Candidatus Baltobacteraceae bacterium]